MAQSQQRAKTMETDASAAQPMQRRQDVPPELQHSVLWAKERPLGAPSRGVQDLMTAAQASAGNAAIQRALARDTATETPQPKTGAPQEVKAEAREDKAEDLKSVLPQTPAVPQAAPLTAPAGARPQQGQP